MIVPTPEPTLLGTVAQMGEVSLAIWRDYRQQARQRAAMRRINRRVAAMYRHSTPTWRTDRLHITVVALMVLGAAGCAFIVFGGVA